MGKIKIIALIFVIVKLGDWERSELLFQEKLVCNKAGSVLAFNKTGLARSGFIILLIKTFLDFLIQTNILKTAYCLIDR